MSLHTDIDGANIDFQHEVGSRFQNEGNDITLSLLANSAATGGLAEFATVTAGNYSLHEIKPKMDGDNDDAAIYLVELRIKENAITAAEANRITVVNYNGQYYQNDVPVAPVFTRRYWKIQLRPTEKP